MTKLEAFLQNSWKRYISLAPDALLISNLLVDRGESIVFDHLAFRTFNLPGIGLDNLGKVFENFGYIKVEDELHFPSKGVRANFFIHQTNPTFPKIFCSELILEKFSPNLQNWIRSVTANLIAKQLDSNELSGDIFLEPSWDPVSFEDYSRFYSESEYAAWTAAFGLQVNHFAILINSLKSFHSLQDLNEFIISYHFILNDSGGLIKGSEIELLEQSSTLAKKVDWVFNGGVTRPIMGCYYEFARRYPIPGGNGLLFQGFVPTSADKIFESNFEKKLSIP